MTEDQAKGMTQSDDFWCSYESVKRVLDYLAESYECTITKDARQKALRLLVMWGDSEEHGTVQHCIDHE